MQPHELAGVPTLGEWMQRDSMNMSLSYDDKSLTDMQRCEGSASSLKDEGAWRAYIEACVKKARTTAKSANSPTPRGSSQHDHRRSRAHWSAATKLCSEALNWIEQNVPGFRF